VQHQPTRLSERLDEETRRNICDDYYRDDPAENEKEDSRKNDVRITRDVKKIKIAVNQSLSAHDPKTDGGQAEHD